MELFKYIVRFFYRIRWWMVIFPCIAGVIAWFMTRDLEKTYDVKTTIFTGIISGYNVDVTDSRNAGVHLSNRTYLEDCLSQVACPLPCIWGCREEYKLHLGRTLSTVSG